MSREERGAIRHAGLRTAVTAPSRDLKPTEGAVVPLLFLQPSECSIVIPNLESIVGLDCCAYPPGRAPVTTIGSQGRLQNVSKTREDSRASRRTPADEIERRSR